MRIEISTLASFDKEEYSKHFDLLPKNMDFSKYEVFLVIKTPKEEDIDLNYDFDTVEWIYIEKYIDEIRNIRPPTSIVEVHYIHI